MTMPKDVQYALNGMYSYATSNPDFDELSVDTITRYIAAQDAEIERLRADLAHMKDVVHAAGFDSITEAVANVVTMRKDAGRYRWLRDASSANNGHTFIATNIWGVKSRWTGSFADEKIDADMRSANGAEGGK